MYMHTSVPSFVFAVQPTSDRLRSLNANQLLLSLSPRHNTATSMAPRLISPSVNVSDCQIQPRGSGSLIPRSLNSEATTGPTTCPKTLTTPISIVQAPPVSSSISSASHGLLVHWKKEKMRESVGEADDGPDGAEDMISRTSFEVHARKETESRVPALAPPIFDQHDSSNCHKYDQLNKDCDSNQEHRLQHYQCQQQQNRQHRPTQQSSSVANSEVLEPAHLSQALAFATGDDIEVQQKLRKRKAISEAEGEPMHTAFFRHSAITSLLKIYAFSLKFIFNALLIINSAVCL
ncbi:unnamed protein product [Protopolystoma xenopodis]|uniref:Uncharacterized protein n=1 Tax=Protopolystoma xenopodis TaxID=117903 RepID=A0A3S5BRM2_9PLAT|nr:unnamed protein product [Protopolystoma xenopodis]